MTGPREISRNRAQTRSQMHHGCNFAKQCDQERTAFLGPNCTDQEAKCQQTQDNDHANFKNIELVITSN